VAHLGSSQPRKSGSDGSLLAFNVDMERWERPACYGILLFALMHAACSKEHSVSDQPRSIEGTLSITQADDSRIAGSYTLNGITLGFDITASPYTLSLSKADGSLLLGQSRIDSDVVTVTTNLMNQGTVTTTSDAFDNELSYEISDDGAVTAFYQSPEASILPYLSPALYDSGVSALAYPLSAQLHMLSASTADELGIDPAATASVPPTSLESISPKADMCQDLRGDPNGDNCKGMCGPRCKCWKWVCGDCCCHNGCLSHDNHCRNCDTNHPINCILCVTFDFGTAPFRCSDSNCPS